MRIISVPLKYVPLVSPVMFAIVMFFLPVFTAVSKPDFIIFDPDVYILSSLPKLLVSKFSVRDVRWRNLGT